MAFNSVDRLAFGNIPYENPVVKSRTKQHIFRSWMPFDDRNSSSENSEIRF